MELKHIAARAGRLSSFLRGEMAMSAGLVNRMKWNEKILVNGIPRHTDFAVSPGDEIVAIVDAPQIGYPPEQGELSVLYEDAYLLAVDKPAGMLIHPSHAKNCGTLANYVAGYYEKTGQECAFHPLTRLDRDTFGVVLLAKNAHVHALVQHTKMQKIYHATVFGCPPQEHGVIDAPIERRPLPSLLRFVGENGKPSVTEYRVVQRYGAYTKLELRPITGRTHQLRVHCAHMGFPILGDPQYASDASAAFSRERGLTYQQLCAHTLQLVHPVTGAPLVIESKMDVTASDVDDVL